MLARGTHDIQMPHYIRLTMNSVCGNEVLSQGLCTIAEEVRTISNLVSSRLLEVQSNDWSISGIHPSGVIDGNIHKESYYLVDELVLEASDKDLARIDDTALTFYCPQPRIYVLARLHRWNQLHIVSTIEIRQGSAGCVRFSRVKSRSVYVPRREPDSTCTTTCPLNTEILCPARGFGMMSMENRIPVQIVSHYSLLRSPSARTVEEVRFPRSGKNASR
ncbi:hypothetical protein J6590_003148 [Homalodisca vitripennis]|nr:hypothetical protein J6590_003148 [Homalodisca vitripennis]